MNSIWLTEKIRVRLVTAFSHYFLFFVYFGLSNKFFSLKNRKLFLKIENKGENSYQTHSNALREKKKKRKKDKYTKNILRNFFLLN